MGANFPDRETLHSVLALATRAPSVGDSQPWQWRVDTDGLQLFADPARPARTDPDRRALLLSCGAALHHSIVALAAMGWHARVDRLPSLAEPGHLAAITLTPRAADDLDVALAAAIARRRTDRRGYGFWPVPWGDVALMGSRAARAGVMLRQIDHAADGLDGWIVGPDRGVAIALGTEEDDDSARLRAGEATSLVLLSATAMGLASCAASEPLDVAGAREALRLDVFGGSGHPQMLVRVGWAAVGAEPLPEAPRRPLSDVADWCDAAGSANPRG
jgi:nitroreductase